MTFQVPRNFALVLIFGGMGSFSLGGVCFLKLQVTCVKQEDLLWATVQPFEEFSAQTRGK